MLQHDNENEAFDLATRFINNSNHPVFLTGKAGTGKTTFLRFIKENTTKNTVIVAPTGVAAINAGGTTMHSFFNLPFSPFIPENSKAFGQQDFNDKNSLAGKLRINNEKRELIQQLELLVIDEISMVRCDVLDAIDTVLRQIRGKHEQPYGGVQVVYIGDMYQLPPVVKEEEWSLLKNFYFHPFFFNSRVIAAQPPVYIELQKVYRQKDPSFIELLNQVRNNELDEEGYHLLHKRFIPDFKAGKEKDFITLTTHNAKADSINAIELASLTTPSTIFKASIDGVFQESAFPAEELLTLKEGAKVMFLKNDSEKIRRFFNGKIGTVQQIEEDKIWVSCSGGSSTSQEINNSSLIEVKRETWRNIRYSLNKKTNQVEEEILGSFTQFPLRLAWAITIHKSQGLTFERAIIDAGQAFAPGQVYVALSRCTSLQELVLKSKISYQSLRSDERVVQFAQTQQKQPEKVYLLELAQKEYQQNCIESLFDFSLPEKKINALIRWNKELDVSNHPVSDWLQQLHQQITTSHQHGINFEKELQEFFKEVTLPEKNKMLQDRLHKAAVWFTEALVKMKNYLLQSPAVFDNRQHATEYNTQLRQLFELLSFQSHLLRSCIPAFSMQILQQQKRSYQKELFTVNAYTAASTYVSKDIVHPQLYLSLKEKRNELAAEKDLPVYLICSTQSIEEMAQYLPRTLSLLEKINGFGPAKLKQYGQIFIALIDEYCEKNQIVTEENFIPEKKSKRKITSSIKKTDTKMISFDLYQQGKMVEEIAVIRNLSVSTIEGHLAHYIETGALELRRLVDEKMEQVVTKVLDNTEETGLNAIKQSLPEHIGFGTLKWVIAARKRAQQSEI